MQLVQVGAVVSFDEHKGYGEVEAEDGERLFFHCTAVADGSRSVPVGADVVFRVVPGHRGRWEAAGLVKAFLEGLPQPAGGEEPGSGGAPSP